MDLKRNEHLFEAQFILVANKIDDDERREVSKQRGLDYAQSQNIELYEVSAKNGLGVHELFDKIARDLILKHKKHMQRYQQ